MILVTLFTFMLDLHPTAGCFSPGSPCSRVPSAYKVLSPSPPSFSANFHIPLNTEIRRNLLWEASLIPPPRSPHPGGTRDLLPFSPHNISFKFCCCSSPFCPIKGCLCPFHQIGSKFPQDRNHPGHTTWKELSWHHIMPSKESCQLS